MADDLRFLLNVVLERNVQRIELRDQQHGIRLVVLDPAKSERFDTFVPAVDTQLPSDMLQQQFPAQTKAGLAEWLAELIRSHLPNIPLRAMLIPPRQAPFSMSQVYFELPQDYPLWTQIQRYSDLALHMTGNFPELRLGLWGVR